MPSFIEEAIARVAKLEKPLVPFDLDELPNTYWTEEVFRICLERAHGFNEQRGHRYCLLSDNTFASLRPRDKQGNIKPLPWYKSDLLASLRGEKRAELSPTPTEPSLTPPKGIRRPRGTSHKMVEFVERRRPRMSWKELWEKWNKQYPNHPYKNENSMKSNYLKTVKNIAASQSQDG